MNEDIEGTFTSVVVLKDEVIKNFQKVVTVEVNIVRNYIIIVKIEHDWGVNIGVDFVKVDVIYFKIVVNEV